MTLHQLIGLFFVGYNHEDLVNHPQVLIGVNILQRRAAAHQESEKLPRQPRVFKNELCAPVLAELGVHGLMLMIEPVAMVIRLPDLLGAEDDCGV